MSMTSDAKRALSTTIRSLRARLLDDLHAATETVYRLAVRARDAGLNEEARTRRTRLEAWIAEQLRAQDAGATKSKKPQTAEDFRREAEKQAAYTLLNRLVILRLMEAPGPNGEPLRGPAVVTGGWESPAYKDFRELAPALVRGDDTEGYAFLLQLVFEDLSTELPGLYGPVGVADLIPTPAATLRHVVQELNKPELESSWTDDMTLGWVYQYWNDPEREDIDKKLHAGGKLEPHEIASKTQLFTERYMVDWLLQNSLGPMWLAMCRKHGWTPDVEAPEAKGSSTLQRLEERGVEWRAKREAGEVSLTDLMPLHADAEWRWAYYVPQPIPDDAVEHAAESVRALKILDPAVGSGHFLVVAMDLLVVLYREEARHRGEEGQAEWTDRAIVERILSHNLHGIDLDPRAVQIAAAALWLKARQIVPDARPERVNLVAPNLRLASLPDNDPALVELRLEVERETGIPGALTDTIVHALRGADHLGSLLKVDRAVDQAIEAHEGAVAPRSDPEQGNMFRASRPQQGQIAFQAAAARRSLLDRVENFLAGHTGGDDLGLRLRGEQLAAGVRFVRMVREGAYDLVVANPPYQGTANMAESNYIQTQYRPGKANLYAAFLLRGLELMRAGGTSAMLTMRNWMFIKEYAGLREHLLDTFDLWAIGDFDRGAFEDVPDELVSVAVGIFRLGHHSGSSVALCPTPRDDRSRDNERTRRKRAATLCHVGRHDFDPAALRKVTSWPLCYWWSKCELQRYLEAPKLQDFGGCREGLGTRDDLRFLRRPWEVAKLDLSAVPYPVDLERRNHRWIGFIKGAEGKKWIEPLDVAVNWGCHGGEIAQFERSRYGRGAALYFQQGIAVATMGQNFSGRTHRFRSVFGDAGVSVFADDLAGALCAMNSTRGRAVLESLNPSTSFKVNDVNRLPLFPIEGASRIASLLDGYFTEHELHREPSVEFRRPGPSPWRHVQAWAQVAVDRPEGAPLPPYAAENDAEPATDHLSYAFGVALGRFGANGEGILDPTKDDLSHALPEGILFLDGTLDGDDRRDGLGHSAAVLLHEAWARYGPSIDTNRKSLRDWLALDFFKDVHKGMYENRPIHWPLSSAQKTFVGWINIHRFTEQTLRILLADYLHPTLSRIEGQLNDLRVAREGADRRAARAAEKQYAKVLKARDELQAFIADVEQCADRGAPPAGAQCPQREQDSRYAPDLDDGVMINAAALWPLLDPQWKDPKKWWKQLSEAKGKKDYDWSHLAMRYWPTRVDEKCQQDPSLGVAHGCFWRYHPGRAWAWELRLQDEIEPDFRIEELPYRPGGRDLGDEGSAPHRAVWLRDHALEALFAVEREAVRRMGRRKNRRNLSEMRILEEGLWSKLPDEVWEMELRLSEKQGAEFRLLAPDEPAARAAYEDADSSRAPARLEFMKSLLPPDNWFGEADNEDDAVSDDEATDEANEGTDADEDAEA